MFADAAPSRLAARPSITIVFADLKREGEMSVTWRRHD
jgi:hypothetical protein